MADVSNAIKTIDSHPLEATYFNGKSYDEMVAIDLTEGDLRNVFKTGLYRTCLERDGTTTLKSQCSATGSYSWAADVVISVQQISDNSAIHIMTDSGYLYFRTVNGTSTDYYWEPYSKLGGGGGGSSAEFDTVNIKASYSALPSYFNGTCTINPNHLISSDYPVVFFDGVLFSSGSYNEYISKDQIFNAAQGAYILNSTPFGVKKGSVSVATDTSTLNNINIGLSIVTNGLGSITISLLGRAAKSFTSHAPSGSIGY